MIRSWKKIAIPAAVVLIFILLPIVFKLGTNVYNLLVLLFVYIILSQSWNLMGGYTGQINLGMAALFGCGVVVGHFTWEFGYPVYLAILAAGFASVILSAIIGLTTLRLKGVYFAIGTLALAQACRIIAGNVFNRMVQMPGSYTTSYDINPRYFMGLGLAVAATLIVYIVVNSKLGLALLAIREDEGAAQVTGINTFKYKVVALLISAFLAGLAGGLYAFFRLSFYSITDVFSPIYTFEPLMAVIIGGAGTIIGPIIGSAFLVILSEVFANTLGEAHLIIFGLLFILVVIYFPHGLVGSWDKIKFLISKIRPGVPGTTH